MKYLYNRILYFSNIDEQSHTWTNLKYNTEQKKKVTWTHMCYDSTFINFKTMQNEKKNILSVSKYIQ